MTKHFWFLTLFLAGLAACGPSDVSARRGLSVEQPRPLHVAGRYLRDVENRAVLLHGVNWSGSWKPAPYGQDATEGEVRFFASLGLNSFRLLTAWSAIMPEEGVIDRKYLANLRQRAQWAAKADMFVIADMHQDVFGEGIRHPDGTVVGNGTPAWVCSAVVQPISPWFFYYLQDQVGACYEKLYTDERLIHQFAQAHLALIETLGDLPNFLGVELLNEPFWGTGSPLEADRQVLFPFYEKVYAELAPHMPGHLLFVEPTVVKNAAGMGLLPALPSAQSVYSPHLYDPRMEFGSPYNGDTSYVDVRFSTDSRDGDFYDAPVWWGEWGNPPAGPTAQRYVGDFIDRADARYSGWAFWESGLVQAVQVAGGPSYVALGLKRAYVERAPGTPSFKWSAADKRLTLTVTGDGAAETWVRAPAAWVADVRLGKGWAGSAKVVKGSSLRIELPALPAGVTADATVFFH